jgi:hypothetical protein
MELEEEWRDIKGYEGRYQVSNLGEIKSLKYAQMDLQRILKPHITARGYYSICLCNNGTSEVTTVHRVVAKTFIDNPLNLPQVNHKDGNKLNNRVDNLEWVTARQNTEHAWKNELKKGGKYLYNTQSVYQFDLNMNFIRKYDTQSEAEEITGIKQGDISKCCNKKRNKAGGFIWLFADGLLTELGRLTQENKELKQKINDFVEEMRCME